MKQYDLLKKNLRGYKVEVDKEKLWQQTVHAIPQKKKRRPIVIPFLFGALLLSGGLAYYHTDSFGQLYKNIRGELSQASAETTTIASNQNVNLNTNNLEAKSILKNNEKPGQLKQTSFSQLHHRNTQATNKRNQGNSYSENTTIKQAPPSSPGDHERKAESIKSEFEQPLTLRFNFPASTIEESRAEADTKSEFLTSKEKIHWSTNSIDVLPLSPLLSSGEPGIKGIKSSSTTPGKPYKNVYSVAILQGLGFSTLSFDARNPQVEDIQDFLTQSTRSLESISTTVRGNVQFTKGFSVSTGVAFRRLTTETIYQNTVTERMEQEGTTTIIIDELGQQHLVSGNIGTTHLTETEHTRYSTHQTVDVELTLHKRLFGVHRTTVNGYLKAGINVFYAAKGSAYNSEYELVGFQDSDNPYSLSSPFTFGVGIDVQHRLSPRWILLGTAGIDQWSIHHQEYNQLQWRHILYSLSLGVGYVL